MLFFHVLRGIRRDDGFLLVVGLLSTLMVAWKAAEWAQDRGLIQGSSAVRVGIERDRRARGSKVR
jgi:hypothetical protein